MKCFRNEDEAKRKLAAKICGLDRGAGARAFWGMQRTPNRGYPDYKAIYIVPMGISYLDLFDFDFFGDFSIRREFISSDLDSSELNRRFNEAAGGKRSNLNSRNWNRITCPLSFNGEDIGAYRYYYPKSFPEELIIKTLYRIAGKEGQGPHVV